MQEGRKGPGRNYRANWGHVAGERPLAVGTRPRYRHKLQRVVPRVVARDDRVHRVVWPPASERAAAAQSGAPTRVTRPAVIVEGDGALERLPLLEGSQRAELGVPGLVSRLVQRLDTQPLAAYPAEVHHILADRPAALLTAQLAAASPELHGVGGLSEENTLVMSGVRLWRSEVLRRVASQLLLPADLLGLERPPLRVWSRRVRGRSRLGERRRVRLPIWVKQLEVLPGAMRRAARRPGSF